jgi:hypothetical protein
LREKEDKIYFERFAPSHTEDAKQREWAALRDFGKLLTAFVTACLTPGLKR